MRMYHDANIRLAALPWTGVILEGSQQYRTDTIRGARSACQESLMAYAQVREAAATQTALPLP